MKRNDLAFEESLSDSLTSELGILEVPLTNRVLFLSGLVIFLAGALILGQVFLLSMNAKIYNARAAANLAKQEELQAPRGLIFDRFGKVLAENEPSFLLFLNAREFLQNAAVQNRVFEGLKDVLEMEPEEVWAFLKSAKPGEYSEKVLLSDAITQSQLIRLKDLKIDALSITEGFRRIYPQGSTLSSVLGYTGFVNAEDLKKDESLHSQGTIGRAGIEAFYDKDLRGESGVVTQFKNAKEEVLSRPEVKPSAIGSSVHLTIDGEFQDYFFDRFKSGLAALGRTTGVGLAMDPKTGEILALMNFPAFDGNLFSSSGRNEEKKSVLNSPLKPLFNRAVSGFYNPGSTIKPLVGIAALKENVITPEREIFSPGYIDIPNPYRPDEPTRYPDWRYQGSMNLASAIAQSSNVYFYVAGGGAPPGVSDEHGNIHDIRGLGIDRLREWWQKFRFGEETGIDLPSEADGLLPDPNRRKSLTGLPWLLGDTYNTSIGQGDLLVTPVQLLSYINAVANGGKLYRPFLAKDFRAPQVVSDLSYLLPEIKEVEKGMTQGVKSPLGTAYFLHDLPFLIAAKTGSAQVKNNTQENAFFVGFASADAKKDAQIAILILIENSKEGSLNTLPIAKDVLNWYYEHRLAKKN